MKGVICAGGKATRLGELTRITNKHLLPVGEWPMIYYALDLLQKNGVNDVLIVTGKDHAGDFINLLGDGRITERFTDKVLFNLNISYRVQPEAGGIAQAVEMAQGFVHPGEKFVVVLADNIFENLPKLTNMTTPTVFVKETNEAHRFGVIDPENSRIVEKPLNPPSNLAVTGVYLYDYEVFGVIGTLSPSDRGELEIAEVNDYYMRHKRLRVEPVDGWWRDAGTQASLVELGSLIAETGANN